MKQEIVAKETLRYIFAGEFRGQGVVRGAADCRLYAVGEATGKLANQQRAQPSPVQGRPPGAGAGEPSSTAPIAPLQPASIMQDCHHASDCEVI